METKNKQKVSQPTPRKIIPLSPEVRAEIERFVEEIRKLEAGAIDPDDFKKFRLENGIYGIRFKPDEHMVRIKILYGMLSPDQLEAIAEVAEKYTPLKIAHITTRQSVQLHNVHRRVIPDVLRIINESGLTTREACGNTVRNVTACPFAGVAADEVFDVIPYADAVASYLLRNPICQNMPRKFKIAFEGCPTDHARVAIHDLGFVAVARNSNGKTERGFQVYVGGGLGGQPFSAQLLEEFMPAELIFATTEAVIRLFDRHGNRKNKNLARIKFVVHNWGIEEFRKQFIGERRAVLATRSGSARWEITRPEESAPLLKPILPTPGTLPEGFEDWKKTNAIPQKQKGFATVFIRCPLGDLTVDQMRDVARLSRALNGGRMRTTITQNLVMNWVREEALGEVYKALVKTGLAMGGAELLPDITRCPGADTCQLAITHSRGLAEVLTPVIHEKLAQDPVLKDLSIKISACPNSCGQHHIADIGFYGTSRTLDGKQVPHYRMLLGGGTSLDRAIFGEAVMQIPARLVAPAVTKLLQHYKAERQGEENFRAFVERVGHARIKEWLAEYTEVPPYAQNPELYTDLGDEAGKLFKVAVGKGECAS